MRDPRRITDLLLILGGLLWALAATTDLDAAVAVSATPVLIGVVLPCHREERGNRPPASVWPPAALRQPS